MRRGVAAQESADGAIDPALELVPVDTLGDLLRNVEERRVVENREHVRREQEFLARQGRAAADVGTTPAPSGAREERRSERLETKFEENEILIGERQEQLDKRPRIVA